MEHVKRKAWVLGLVAWVLVLPALAADLTRGITFTDGQRITAAQLHSLVDSASIGVAFVTGKSLLGTVDSADYVLIYDTSAGTFKKMTLATLLTGNTDLITTQTEEANPASNDMLLIYDTSGVGLVKVSITNLVYNTNLIHALPTITSNVLGTAKVKLLNGGTNVSMTLDSLWLNGFNYTRAITNLSRRTQPTNNDAFLLWDSVAGTNRWATWIDLVTNTPSVATVSNAALLSVLETNQFKNITVSNLMLQFGNSGMFYTTNLSFTTTNKTLVSVTAAGTVMNQAHSLAAVPRQVRGVLVNTTSEHGFAVGDEVAFEHIYSPTHILPVSVGANATNVFVIVSGDPSTSWQVRSKDAGTWQNITDTSWSMRVYANP